MNRHERRRARRIDKDKETKFFNDYVAHLPRVPLNEPLERGRVYHMVVAHDDWCAFYGGGECNCNPEITQHIEPKRS